MYYETFKRMKLPTSMIRPSLTTFYGIVPGRKAYPLGRVTLDVAFGTENNFRKEKISFEIVDFKSPYHCVLGRTAFAKFMARPCYTYNRMKIPGPNGVIDVLGNMEKAIECEEDWLRKQMQQSQLRRPMLQPSPTNSKASPSTPTVACQRSNRLGDITQWSQLRSTQKTCRSTEPPQARPQSPIMVEDMLQYNIKETN